MKESNDDASIKSVNIKRLRIMVKYIGKRIVFNAISIDMKFLGQSKENAMVVRDTFDAYLNSSLLCTLVPLCPRLHTSS